MADTMPSPETPENDAASQASQAPTAEAQYVNTDDTQGQLTGDVRNFVLLAHCLGIIYPIIAPLLIWLLKKEELPAIEPQCKETLNFQITFYGLMFILGGPLGWIPFLGWCITLPIALVLWVVSVVMLIIATVAASNGKPYTFFWKLQLIK